MRGFIAFGFGGIHDPEEAQDFAGTVVDNATGEILQRATGPRPGPEAYPADKFETNLPKWRELVQTGQKTTAQIIGMVQSRAALSAEQLREIFPKDQANFLQQFAQFDPCIERSWRGHAAQMHHGQRVLRHR